MKSRLPIEIDPVLDIAREAGKLLLSYREPHVRLQKKVPHTITEEGLTVTQADMLSNRYLIERLSALQKDVKVISKEQDDAINAGILEKHTHYWLVNPLDQTAHYIRGGDAFSINIALLEDGIPIFGVLYFPALDRFYLNDGKHHAFRIEYGGNPVMLKSHIPPDHVDIFHAHGQMRSLLVAEGMALSCTHPEGLRPWSVAATSAIINAAGIYIKDTLGNNLNFSSLDVLPTHFVATPAAMNMLLSNATQFS
jgi:3'-phosphoadenosine 5'-phosphosulfate (PAPS) 3'-phosphatase